MIDVWGLKGGSGIDIPVKKRSSPRKKRNPYMISLFLWLSFKNLTKWFSYRNDKISEVFLRWFSFSKMPAFQKIQAMIFTFRWPQFLCLKNSLFNDKENDILYVMIRGKSPWFRNEGAGACHIKTLSHSERYILLSFRKDGEPIISKC